MSFIRSPSLAELKKWQFHQQKILVINYYKLDVIETFVTEIRKFARYSIKIGIITLNFK